MIAVDEIRAAEARIRGFVRRTPIFDPVPTLVPLRADAAVTLKLECLQVTGSFKARGAMSKLRSLDPAVVERGIVTASGGNHGIAVAYAGRMAGRSATIFVPDVVSPLKAQKIESWGARLVRGGAVFDDANREAVALAARDNLAYFHPFADRAVMAGQGTLGLEIFDQIPQIDSILVAIGGGGLIAGLGSALKALRPGMRVIGIEPIGAPTVRAALDAGRVVDLPALTTIVSTMAARRSEPETFAICQEVVDDVVLVSDEAMQEAARVLWRDCGVAADLSGAASIAALMTGVYKPRPGERVCALICGAGGEGVG